MRRFTPIQAGRLRLLGATRLAAYGSSTAARFGSGTSSHKIARSIPMRVLRQAGAKLHEALACVPCARFVGLARRLVYPVHKVRQELIAGLAQAVRRAQRVG